ncbi:MAG: hypothetical protein O7G87_12480, partial [bacterium]|nr:hypothetical protein [bacterium]
PTPTTRVNERRVEHYRRVHHARVNYSEGIEVHHGRGWDRRGDVYIRFGHPDHQSWSDYLVFETDEKVARVKNRLNAIAGEALEEVYRSKHVHGQSQSGYGVEFAIAEIKGMPTFPIPSRRSVMANGSELGYKWEVWIYAEVAGGIEVTFLDPTGKGLYDYAPVPPNSINHALWSSLAPENVVARVANRTPSIYNYDYGGDPLDFYLYTADFRDEKGTGLEVYMGVPVDQLGRKEQDGVVYASLDREVVIYNSSLQAVFRDSVQAQEIVPGDVSAGTLMVDQVRAGLRPGKYFMAIQVRDPVSKRIQVHKGYVELEAYGDLGLRLSDLEVAGLVTEREDEEVGKFRKGVLEVIPMPSKTFVKGQTVYLYYELYNLVRDSFGQTKYRVDYTLKGSDPSSIARVLGGVGRLLGRSTQKDGVRVSYEHSGQSDWESIYISLDVSPVEGDELEVEVQVTDLNAPGKPSDAKTVRFVLGD